MARDQGLDLVEVAPNSDPPVCRILDYGKLRYLHSKKEREARKNQKFTELREVRFRPNIGDHDLFAKVRKIRELLNDGAKVKLAVRFRGREVAHSELGLALLKQVTDVMKEDARLETAPAMEGRSMSIILAPVPKKTAATTEVTDVAEATEVADVAAVTDVAKVPKVAKAVKAVNVADVSEVENAQA